MGQHRDFSAEEAREIGERIGIDWSAGEFDVEQFRMGLTVELEHGRRDPATNVSDDDEITTGKIAWAHLNEFPDYYARLAKMEAEAERYWSERGPRRSSVAGTAPTTGRASRCRHRHRLADRSLWPRRQLPSGGTRSKPVGQLRPPPAP